MARMAALAVVACVLGWASATTYIVNNPVDNSGECNGNDNCNMRGAWDRAGGGDTIRVEVDIQMEGYVIKNGRDRNWSGFLTVEGALNGGSQPATVTPQASHDDRNAFIQMIYMDESDATLVLKNLNIKGFTNGCTGNGACEGGAVHISIDEGLTTEEQYKERHLARKGLKAGPPHFHEILSLEDVTFTQNQVVQESSNNVLYGGALAVIGCGKGNVGGCSVSAKNVKFHNNSIVGGTNPAGSAVFLDGEVNLFCTDCHFAGNYFVNTRYNHNMMPGGGAVWAAGGDVTLNGGGFGRNHGGNGLAVALNVRPTKFGQNNGNVFITGTKFNHNSGDSNLQPGSTALIQAQHLHVNQSSIMNTDNRLYIATTVDDQYYANCSLSGHTELNGFSYYIRNLRAGAAHLTGVPQSSFNNCTQGKPWLPCPSGSTCKNVMNNMGTVVAYDCLA